MVSASHSCSGAASKVWESATVFPFFAGLTVRVTAVSWAVGV